MSIAHEYPKNRNLQDTSRLIASSHTMREMNEDTQKQRMLVRHPQRWCRYHVD